ncbi:MAG: hypothetical protein IPM47_17715 [Sphingobacteriales bacterium]|nr:MAG: hypothetical protein IPM47_17715 [Sphingobacteriales bacterium]
MTIERKIKIEEEQIKFIENYSDYGFHNMDEMIVRALELLKQQLEMEIVLAQSADLYADMYEADEETKDWTASAIKDWE